jgi:hypothetical protein
MRESTKMLSKLASVIEQLSDLAAGDLVWARCSTWW